MHGAGATEVRLLERPQRVDPEALEVGTERGHRLGIHGVQPPRAVGAIGDQLGVFENPQMLRNRGTTHRQVARDIDHRQRPFSHQPRENGPASRIAECVELD